jgi:hypothetical protein
MNGPPSPVADAPGSPAPHRRLWRWFYDFWARPLRAEPLALFRILIGATILASLLTSLGPRLSRDLGPDGLYPGQAADDWLRRGGVFCLLRGPANLPLLDELLPAEAAAAWRDWCDEPAHAVWMFGVLVAAAACLTLGLCTRTATVVAWALFVSFNQRLLYLLNGGDSMMRCALFYLMFAPSGAVWSLDRLLRDRSRTPEPASSAAQGTKGSEPVLIPAWPVRLMQIQLALVYFFTGVAKLGWDWIDGEAVYWVLNDFTLTRWPYHCLPVPIFVCQMLSWMTLIFEIGFSFFVAVAAPHRLVVHVRRFRLAVTVPALRPWVLLVGLALHLGVLIHTEVGWFSPATVAWYALFLSGDGVRNFFRRLTPDALRRRPVQ